MAFWPRQITHPVWVETNNRPRHGGQSIPRWCVEFQFTDALSVRCSMNRDVAFRRHSEQVGTQALIPNEDRKSNVFLSSFLMQRLDV